MFVVCNVVIFLYIIVKLNIKENIYDLFLYELLCYMTGSFFVVENDHIAVENFGQFLEKKIRILPVLHRHLFHGCAGILRRL